MARRVMLGQSSHLMLPSLSSIVSPPALTNFDQWISVIHTRSGYLSGNISIITNINCSGIILDQI